MSPAEENKCPSDSTVKMTEIVLPIDTNTHGNVLGGKVLHVMDIAAAMAAMRHCRKPVVTAALDHMEFHSPIPEGHFMITMACPNYVGQTSMEIGVKVLSENPLTGERRHTSSAYLTFVALDLDGGPTSVPPLDPKTAEEKRRWQEGKKRTEERRRRRRS